MDQKKLVIDADKIQNFFQEHAKDGKLIIHIHNGVPEGVLMLMCCDLTAVKLMAEGLTIFEGGKNVKR